MRRISVFFVVLIVLGATGVRTGIAGPPDALHTPDAPVALSSGRPPDEPPGPLTLFWGDGCPHCASEWEFLSDLSEEFPALEIVGYEVWYNDENQLRFFEAMAEFGEEPVAVPTTLFEGQLWIGFGPEIEREIRGAVEAAFTAQTPSTVPTDDQPMTLPLLGAVDAENTSLIVGTFVIGFVDGFNPCSLWALSMLLALVLRTGSRRRVIAVGSVFLLVTAGLYGLYIAGLYSALQFVAHAVWVRSVIAVVALVFGLINLKDYWWFRRGPSLTISDNAKPRLYRRMRAVATEERSLLAVLGGTVVLAAGVSLLETPCTAGYPLLWADLVSARGVSTATAVGLFALYMFVFLVDEFAVFGAAVVAMRVTKLEERHGRVLKLVSGMLMVVLAVVLVTAPELMTTVAGAVITFAVAAVATMGVLLWDRSRTRSRQTTG